MRGRDGGRQLRSRPAPTSPDRFKRRILNVRDLFDRHYDELYRYVARLSGDADLAADIAQEAFIRWIEHEPADTQPRAWLFTVATNLFRDRARVQARRAELLREAPDRAPIGDAPADPVTTLEARELDRAVRESLDTLSLRDRTILLLQQDGFSHQEIAAAVDTTTKSVGTMLSRALKKFRAAAADRLEPYR